MLRFFGIHNPRVGGFDPGPRYQSFLYVPIIYKVTADWSPAAVFRFAEILSELRNSFPR
jgi:hypothetical protein